ncbi:MAG TPA: tripartite tricarboxylate transporter TctB family protein [Rhodobacteraceae bacterium]|nr:tripartite tricarboxylate transporter TctB family protein [Paracoccaceae bacterium]
MTKKTVDRAVLALIIVMAVLLYVSTANYPGIAKTTSAKYVRFLAVFIGGLSVVQLGHSLLRDRSLDRLILTGHLPRFLGLLLALIVFSLVFEPLGFFIPAAVFIPTVAFMLGYRNPIIIGLTTAGVLGFVYLVFVKLLSVNLPGINL